LEIVGLIDKGADLIVIDLSAVTHIDTSGLATLLEIANIARDRSVRLRLQGISGQPRRIAELTQMGEIFRALGSEVEFLELS
jgi:anti-sigma B factor antagonist